MFRFCFCIALVFLLRVFVLVRCQVFCAELFKRLAFFARYFAFGVRGIIGKINTHSPRMEVSMETKIQTSDEAQKNEAQVKDEGKLPLFLRRTFSGISSAKASAVLFLLMLLNSFALADGDSFTTGLTAEITAIKSELYTIGAAILGVVVVFVIYRFVKSMLRG